MSSLFDIRTDAPGLLRAESLKITLKFERTGPATGRISWNIPAPAAGCTAETQAYCGIIITLDTNPPNSTTIPKNGLIYKADPTADKNLFAGSKIGSSMVVGAFYQDRTTTFVDITGLRPNVSYYVSGYPVDCQNRYFTEGVHAFSLHQNNKSNATSGFQIIEINPPNGVKATDFTNLAPTVNYTFEVVFGFNTRPVIPLPRGACPPNKEILTTITINGTNAHTYEELINEINKQFALLQNCPQGPLPPNTGMLYWKNDEQKLFTWNGSSLVEIPVYIQSFAPNDVDIGSWWFNTTNNKLYFRNLSGWVEVSSIHFSTDPSQPVCDQTIWFDGTRAFLWTGNSWCEQIVYNQLTDPSLIKDVPCGSFWYDTQHSILYKWNDKNNIWIETGVIQSVYDPNILPIGAFWFHENQNKLFTWNTPNPGWNEVTTVRIVESEPTFPVPGMLWYNPTTKILLKRDITNTMWEEIPVIVFPVDPTQRISCDVWWNTDTEILFVWNVIDNSWNEVTTFFQQSTDPTLPPSLNDGDIWYNPQTDKLYVWRNNCFINEEFISWSSDPLNGFILNETTWFDTTTKKWYVWNGTGWNQILPTYSPIDPTIIPINTYWFNTSNNSLQLWNGISWIPVLYTENSIIPSVGACWFDTSTDTLKEWDGYEWVIKTAPATVELNCKGNLVFTNTLTGGDSAIAVRDITLFKSLGIEVKFLDPVIGADEVSNDPSYNQLGIGTDGSPDERYKLMNEIRYDLGYPTVDVELTPEQIDLAITKALEEIRERASAAYKRGFFFLQVRPETQRYLLTNKTAEFNKIVSVLGVYRLTSAFLSSAHGAGVYGQIVLQHLYNMGTFDLLSYHIISEYTELLEILFAGRITFTWNEQKRELWLHHRFPFAEKMILLEVAVERTEQDIINDRYLRPWIRRFAAAQARLILAEIRGKYSTLPGAGGSVTLNASDLRADAEKQIQQCLDDLDAYVSELPEEYGMGTQFLLG